MRIAVKSDLKSKNFCDSKSYFLLREKVEVEAELIKNCGHNIPIEASSIALNYILKKFNS